MCKLPAWKWVLNRERTWGQDWGTTGHARTLPVSNLSWYAELQRGCLGLQRLWSSRLLLALTKADAGAFNYESFYSVFTGHCELSNHALAWKSPTDNCNYMFA